MSDEVQPEVAHQAAAIGEADTSIESGVLESLCDLAIRGHGFLADYLRFTRRIRCTNSDGAVEEPVGTVRTALETWRLVPGAVDESRWAVFPRRELLWEDVCRLSRPFDEFPEVPKCVAGIIPPRGFAVRCPRVAYYFGAVVETQDDSVKKRYATSYVLEWAHAVAESLTAEHVVYNRVWVCEERCVEFLRKFESFDDFVVDVVGHEIALVSFRGLVLLLATARGLSKSFLQSRVDYTSATSVSWAIVRPGSSEFVLPGVR